MSTVYKYERSVEEVHSIVGPSVFLAGPTVRGHQPHLTSWRFAAVEEFNRQEFKGSLIIPEFTVKNESDKGKAWSKEWKEAVPIWEFNGLRKADCIMFWIPRTRELIGLTTNWEHGYWVGKDPERVVYGRPDDAYRMGYLDIMWEATNEASDRDGDVTRPIYRTLGETVGAAIRMANGDNLMHI